MALFYAHYQATTCLLSSQLSFAMSKGGGGAASVQDHLLGPGRLLLVHQVPTSPITSSSSASSPTSRVVKIAAPCLAVVLSDPLGSFSDDDKHAKQVALAALSSKTEASTSKSKGSGLGMGVGLGLGGKGKLGVGGGAKSSSSSSASDNPLSQRPLSDLYVWVLVLVPQSTSPAASSSSSEQGGGVACPSSVGQRVSLEHISMLFEAKAPPQSVASSSLLLGLPPPAGDTAAPSSSSSATASTSFGGMKMKMKMKGDDEDMFGMKAKGGGLKKGGKATSALSTGVASGNSSSVRGAGSNSALSLSGTDCRAALVLQLFDFVHDLAAAGSPSSSPPPAVLDVSAAIKHREFEFAESCLKHGRKARETLAQFECWRYYLNSFVDQQTAVHEAQTAGGSEAAYVQRQNEFLTTFLLEHRLFCAKEKV